MPVKLPNLHSISVKYPDLLFARLYYLAYMGGSGFINPFVNLFYVSLNFSGKQIGTIASTSSIVGLFAAPLLVNRIKKHPRARSFLQLALALGALAYFAIGQQSSYLPVILLITLQALAISGISPISDAMAVSISRVTDAGYGSIRVFGSLGWIFMVPISGWVVQRWGLQSGFSGVSLAWLCAAGLVFFISAQHFTSQTQGQPQTNLRVSFGKVFHNRTLFGFAIAIVAIGFLNNGVLQFENVFLSRLGASKQLISIAGIMGAIVELPFMLISDRIMRRMGPHPMLLVALTLTCLQRVTVLLLPSIATIMVVRFIGGMAFSLYTISFIGLISSNTEAHETGTILALYTVTLGSLVNIVASPLMGELYDLIGPRWLYAFSASGYAIAVASLWITRPKRAEAGVV